MNNDLANASLTGRPHSVPLAAVATPAVQPLAPASSMGSVPQSPVGVAAAAAPLQGAGNTPAFVTAPAPTSVKLNAQIVPDPAPLQPGPNFHMTTQTVANAQIDNRTNPVWSTYIGFSGDDRLLNITLDPNPNATQPIVVVGFTQNPNDATDIEGLVARLSNDGSTATLSTIDLGANTRTELHSAVVDPNDGSIYVAGQVTQNGVTTDLVARIHSNPSGVDWSLSHAPLTSATANSVALDSTGKNLYVTGAVDGNTSVSELTGLAGQQPTTVYDVTIPYTDANNNPVMSVGNGIAPDSAGNANLAIQIQSTPDAQPAVAQVSSDGTTVNWTFTFIFTYPDGSMNGSTGPNGTMNGVFVDSSDNVFFTGGAAVSSPPLLDDLIVESDSLGNLIGGGRVTFTDDNGNPVQGVGYSVQVDSLGNVFTGITDSAVVNGSLQGNMAVLVFDPAFNILADQFQGGAFGSNDDENRGLVLDPTNSALYMAGFTNSPDFNFVDHAFQSTYGGDPFDGVVVGYHVA